MSKQQPFYIEPLVMLATIGQWLVLATIVGVMVGAGVGAFLLALEQISNDNFSWPFWLQATLLPLGGLANGLLLYYGYRWSKNKLKDQVIAAVHDQNGYLPRKTIPLKPLAALITLGSGGSAGKEGPGSHLGASLASAFGQTLKLNTQLQKRLVACGVSAGFASVFGTPLAGAIYGVEVLAIGRIRHDFLLPAIIGGVTAFYTCQFMGVSYDAYATYLYTDFSELLFIKIIVLGICCGLAARLYVDSVHYSKQLFAQLKTRLNLWPPLAPCLGGAILSILIIWLPTDYLGLSLPLMDAALAGQTVAITAFFWKAIFVAITLGSGFYGGVVTPQFVIGAVAGNAIAQLLGIDPAMGAATGLIAVMASASNTPIAAILMAAELFGADGLVYIGVAAMSAYLVVGHRSIYPGQRFAYTKSSWIHIHPDLPVGREKGHLAYGLLKWWSQLKHKRK